MKSKYKRFFTCLALLMLVISAEAQPTVTKISAGLQHSLFIKSDGSLWGMGDNGYGELGAGMVIDNFNRPTQIVSNNVTTIAAGSTGESLFRQSDGSLWAMGEDVFGQLGNGFGNGFGNFVVFSPEQIVSNQVGAIAAGGSHCLFTKFHNPAGPGSFWDMGYNHEGQLGDGTTNNTNLPEQILFVAHSTAVSAIAAGGSQSLFVKPDGSLWAMGGDQYGQLGDGNAGLNVQVNSPEEIVASNVMAVAAGNDHSLFLNSDGSLWAMGRNSYGQLGDGTTNDSHIPKLILSGNVTAIAAGVYYSLFLKSDGSFWAVGYNGYGQLGDGTTNNRFAPFEVLSSGVTAISAGVYHSLFLKSDGSLWGMGRNSSGQLGDGTYNDTHQPEMILGQPPALGISTYDNQPVVFFPTGPGYGHVLQMTTDLASTNWTTVTDGIPFTGVQITNAPVNAFFRLY